MIARSWPEIHDVASRSDRFDKNSEAARIAEKYLDLSIFEVRLVYWQRADILHMNADVAVAGWVVFPLTWLFNDMYLLRLRCACEPFYLLDNALHSILREDDDLPDEHRALLQSAIFELKQIV